MEYLDSLPDDSIFSVLEEADSARKDRDEKKWRYTKTNGEVVIVRDRFDKIAEGFDKYAKIVHVAFGHSP